MPTVIEDYDGTQHHKDSAPIEASNPLVRYKLLAQVGKGSYGKVYRASERAIDDRPSCGAWRKPAHQVPPLSGGSSRGSSSLPANAVGL